MPIPPQLRKPRKPREVTLAQVLRAVPEAEWQQTVIASAERAGWKVYHTHDSRKSNPGWPDLFCARDKSADDRRCLGIELKKDGEDPRPDQREWLELLVRCGIECFILRPSDRDELESFFR